MLCYEGKISLYSFSGTFLIVFILSLSEYIFEFVPNIWGAILWGPLLYYIVINISCRLLLAASDYQIVVRASFLGFVLAFSSLLFLFGSKCWQPFGAYGAFMAIFHYSEYLAIAWSNSKSLSLDSFILNHSLHYNIAAVASWTEFVVELYFFPNLKGFIIPIIIGSILCAAGEILRKLAIVTANSNFNHVVQFTKSANHELVTYGVYRLMRHPSYVGWFYWSIGTQIILLNPICIVMYTIVSWRFFKERVFMEEITLLNFFGKEYFDYQMTVPTGLPFIRGYLLEKYNFK